MKSIQLLGMAVAVAFSGSLVMAQSSTNISATVNQAIPDADPFGLSVTNDLSGFVGAISSITVSLNISNGINGDLYGYLAGPNGGFAVLFNRVGVTSGNSFGYGDAGFDVTFDDAAANGDIHPYQTTLGGAPSGQLTGTWQPDGRNIDPQSAPGDFDTAARDASLSSFDATDPNGTWTLFLADLSSGGQSTLASWDLNVTTVPEPSFLALLGLGALGITGFLRRSHRRRLP